MQNEIAFRTSPMITPFLFKKCCDQIESDIPDIDLYPPCLTTEDVVLEYFFELKYKPLTQITGWTDETRRPEYAYELKPEYVDEFKELTRQEAASDALYKIIMQHKDSFVEETSRRLELYYTEDPVEHINDCLYNKYMEED